MHRVNARAAKKNVASLRAALSSSLHKFPGAAGGVQRRPPEFPGVLAIPHPLQQPTNMYTVQSGYPPGPCSVSDASTNSSRLWAGCVSNSVLVLDRDQLDRGIKWRRHGANESRCETDAFFEVDDTDAVG